MLSPAEQVEQNLFALPYFQRWSPRVEVHDGEDLLWSITDIPLALFNSVTRARLDERSADAAIEGVIARCRERGVPALWWTGPSSTPRDLGERLVAHGFSEIGQHPGMVANVRELAPVPLADGIEIHPVRDLADLRTWNDVPEGPEERYELYASTMDAFRHYNAFFEGEPVGIASLFPAAGVAGLYNVYTVPELRRHGVGAALTGAALGDALSLGYETAVLQASPMSVSLYRRFGFAEVSTIGLYVLLM